MRSAVLLVALASCLAGSLLAAATFADESWGYELAGDLMSPYCPGRALSECPSPKAGELRTWILDQEEAGRSRTDVETQLYDRFGEQLRQAPKAEGVGLVAYAVPVGVFAAGGLLVAVFLRRARNLRPESPAAAPSPSPSPSATQGGDDEFERLLDEELGG